MTKIKKHPSIQGSKKKARHLAYIQRQAKRQISKNNSIELDNALSHNNIELAATLMGIKLK